MKGILVFILILISLNGNSNSGHTYHVSLNGRYTLVSQLANILRSGDRVEIANGSYYDHFIGHNNVTYVLDNGASIYYLANNGIPTVSDGGMPSTFNITGGQIDRGGSSGIGGSGGASSILLTGGSHVTLNTIVYNQDGDALTVVNSNVTSIGGTIYSNVSSAITINGGNLILGNSTIYSGGNNYSIKDNGLPVTVNLLSDCRANNPVSPMVTIAGANLIIQ